ncbi:MAG: ribosome assembly factor SBDS [Candidatus Altiarchaeota archaeon]
MVSLDDSVIVRLKSHGHTFEIFVDPDLSLEFRSGKDIPIGEILAVEQIFKDAGAGDKASDDVLEEVLGSSDISTAASIIIKKGELHLTTDQKRRMVNERRKQVASIIARNAINPQTKAPHPLTRIEKAMEEARVTVDLQKSANEQVEKVLKLLLPIIPIKFEKVSAAVKIPASYAGKAYNLLREFGEIKKEEWVAGDLISVIEMPAGLQDDFYSKINNFTHGEVKIKKLE